MANQQMDLLYPIEIPILPPKVVVVGRMIGPSSRPVVVVVVVEMTTQMKVVVVVVVEIRQWRCRKGVRWLPLL